MSARSAQRADPTFMSYGMLGGCDCCGPTCSPACAQVFNVAGGNGDCEPLQPLGADCIAALDAQFEAGPPSGWSVVDCWSEYGCTYNCVGPDCDEMYAPPNNCGSGGPFEPSLEAAISFIGSQIGTLNWAKTGVLLTGPCSAFCLEFVADGVTSYATYGPIGTGATLWIPPITGDNVSCSLAHCGACDPD